MMALFLQVFACRSATVHEEAMLAIGALSYATGPEFSKYMPKFYTYLKMVLQLQQFPKILKISGTLLCFGLACFAFPNLMHCFLRMF